MICYCHPLILLKFSVQHNRIWCKSI